MSEVTLTAETGRSSGKGPARRARAEGRIPAVIYGGGEPADAVTFDRAELQRALGTKAGRNALIRVELEGDSFLTLVREIQQHPIRRDITHVDLLKVDPTKPVEMDIPIRLVGEAKKVTVMGGMTEQRLNTLRVRVRPDQIPPYIDVDISDMRLDRSLLVKDVPMPEGVVCLTSPQQAVVTAELTRAAVVAQRADGDESSEEE